MTKENPNVQKFVFAVNDMINSKYILVDRKISAVLSAIASTTEVYNLVAECMVNFDFLEEWKNATKGEFLKLPDTPAKKISFIFCLLNNIDDHNIDIIKVLQRYFSYDKNVAPYELFNKTIMVQFEKLILCNLKTNNEQEEIPDVQSLSAPDDFNLLVKLLNDLIKTVEYEKKIKGANIKTQDVTIIISTFIIVVKKHEIDYFYAFLAILNSIFCKDKKYEKIIDKIIDIANKIIGG